MECSNQAQRLRVIVEAERIVASGAHYYWGCQSSGVFNQHAVHMMPNRWGQTDQEKRVYAAEYGHGGPCAGRCAHPAVAGLPAWNGPRLPGPSEAPHKWPRYFRDLDEVNPGPQGLVHGESCAGKEHYDCAGYVRHCFATALGHAPGDMRERTTVVWTRARGGPLSRADIYPGDLVYGADGHHVGMVSGKREYGAAFPDCAYHAYSARTGVLRVPMTGCGWIAQVRRWNRWGTPTAVPSAIPDSIPVLGY
jgi:cell wall-associated NlpC family hydrolase